MDELKRLFSKLLSMCVKDASLRVRRAETHLAVIEMRFREEHRVPGMGVRVTVFVRIWTT